MAGWVNRPRRENDDRRARAFAPLSQTRHVVVVTSSSYVDGKLDFTQVRLGAVHRRRGLQTRSGRRERTEMQCGGEANS